MKGSSLYLVIHFPLFLSVVFFASKSKIRERKFPEEERGHLSVKSNRLEGNRRRGAREKERGEEREQESSFNGMAKKRIEER